MARRTTKLFAGTIAIVAILLLASAQQARDARHADRERFIGTWELVSTEQQLADGSKRPYLELGKDGKGFLMYSADGHMCAELMNPDRPKWKDDRKPTDEERPLP
jgi:Lipocalin-like domain